MHKQEREDARRWEPPQDAPEGISETPGKLRQASNPIPPDLYSKEYYHLPGITVAKELFYE